MDAEVIVKLNKLVRLQMGLNDKNMFEVDLVQIVNTNRNQFTLLRKIESCEAKIILSQPEIFIRYDQIVIGSCDLANIKTSTTESVFDGHAWDQEQVAF